MSVGRGEPVRLNRSDGFINFAVLLFRFRVGFKMTRRKRKWNW